MDKLVLIKIILLLEVLNLLRWIIPRSLSYILEEIKKRTLFSWKIFISYLEIYNNEGYDLLYENKRYELENDSELKLE